MCFCIFYYFARLYIHGFIYVYICIRRCGLAELYLVLYGPCLISSCTVIERDRVAVKQRDLQPVVPNNQIVHLSMNEEKLDFAHHCKQARIN